MTQVGTTKYYNNYYTTHSENSTSNVGTVSNASK